MFTGDPLINALWLVPLGVITGILGTLVGVGGGFIIVPVILVVFPDTDPLKVTSLSLAVITLNAISGSWAYAQQRRIDWKRGTIFALAGIPGVVLGTWLVAQISRSTFAIIMGWAFAALGIFMLWGSFRSPRGAEANRNLDQVPHSNIAPKIQRWREIAALGIAMFVGLMSTVLGIGGGVIYVPALIYILNYSTHRATATSQFVLACLTGMATLIHFAQGDLVDTWFGIATIGVGMIAGAQIGAQYSSRVSGKTLLRVLAILTIAIGARSLATRH